MQRIAEIKSIRQQRYYQMRMRTANKSKLEKQAALTELKRDLPLLRAPEQYRVPVAPTVKQREKMMAARAKAKQQQKQAERVTISNDTSMKQ
jgi:hypothetical protein